MQQLVYDVFPDGDAWRFMHGDTISFSYLSRSAALHAAETYALQAGCTAHIRVFSLGGRVDEERIFIRASDQCLNDGTDPIFPLNRSPSNEP